MIRYFPVLLLACSESNFSNLEETEKGNGALMEVTPSSLNFGTVNADGDPVVRSFNVKNVGASDLNVEHILIEGEQAVSFLLVEEFHPFLLPPGGDQDVEVLFYPQGTTDQFASALVSSDAEVDSVADVSLQGFGAVPELSVIPNPLDLGMVYVGCDVDNDIILSNSGSDDLIIYAVEHSGGVFELTYTPTFPITLAPGEFTNVGIRYTPLLDEVTEGFLTTVSNDPNNGGISLSTQKGGGEYIAEHIQSWENPVDPPSDIVFSVDLSCSMGDDASRLANNFQDFINELSNYSTDWQVMVANNDNGCTHSGILTPNTPNYQSTFASAAQSGGGSYTESLLTVARNAIDNTDPGECNAGFMRSNAMLHVIMVSDEREQSYGNWSDYVNQIVTKKGDINNVRLSSIAGMVPYGGCADAGTGYWDATNATGGIFLDICSDWSTPVNLELLAEASVISNSYPLDYPAAETTIEVFINGQPIFGTWHYDSSLNAVQFDSNPPEEGDFIMITYAEVAVCD